jgi:hypothetical protein
LTRQRDGVWRPAWTNWPAPLGRSRLDTVIDGGATSSEILMGLRWTLSELSMKERGLRRDLMKRAVSLRTAIDEALS